MMRRLLAGLLAVAFLGLVVAGDKWSDLAVKKRAGSTQLEVIPGAQVRVYEPGATASSSGSGTTVTMYTAATITAGITLSISGQACTVVSVNGNQVVVSPAVTWVKGDRFLRTGSPVTIFADEALSEALPIPTLANTSGLVKFYVDTATHPKFDISIYSGGGLVAILENEAPAAAGGSGGGGGGGIGIDPGDYGAIPDDGADDTSAIQGAVNAACASGRSVHFQKGEYTLAGNNTSYVGIIQMPCGLDIGGEGAGRSIIKIANASGPYWAMFSGTTTAGVASSTPLSHTHIHHLTFDHNTANNPLTRNPLRRNPLNTAESFADHSDWMITFATYAGSDIRINDNEVLGGHGVWAFVVNGAGGRVWFQNNNILGWGADPGLSGTHTGSSGSASLIDSTKNWDVDGLKGAVLMNLTKRTWGVVGSNTATQINVLAWSGEGYPSITVASGDSYSINIDSSLFYFHLVAGEMFVHNNTATSASVSAPFARSAFETHGSNQLVTGNHISGFHTGMNITGIAQTDSTGIVVSNNTLENVQQGIVMWSNPYVSGGHVEGYGIDGATITGNVIRFADLHARPAGSSVIGIGLNPSTSGLSARGITIDDNQLFYPVETVFNSGHAVNSSSYGIGWYDQTRRCSVSLAVCTVDGDCPGGQTCNHPSLEDSSITNNVISGFPQAGIRLSCGIDNVKVSGNTLINNGNTLDNTSADDLCTADNVPQDCCTGLGTGTCTGIPVAYRTPLFYYPPAGAEFHGLEISNNAFIDTLPTTRITQFIYGGTDTLLPVSGNSITDNTFLVTGTDKTQYSQGIYLSSSAPGGAGTPYVSGMVNTTGPVIAGGAAVASGSNLLNTATGRTWYARPPANQVWAVLYPYDFSFGDGDSDSPATFYVPQTGSVWALSALQGSGFYIAANSANREEMHIANYGTERSDLIVEGVIAAGEDFSVSSRKTCAAGSRADMFCSVDGDCPSSTCTNTNGGLYFHDDDGTDNYIRFLAPAAIAGPTNITCQLTDSTHPIPDACVGNGQDDNDGGPGGGYTGITNGTTTATKTATEVMRFPAGSGFTWTTADATDYDDMILALDAQVVELATLGAADTVVQVNAGGTALEYAKINDLNMNDDFGDFACSGLAAGCQIDTGAINFGDIASINTNRLLGRVTAAVGIIEELTPAQATTVLDVFTSSLKGLVPPSGGGTTLFLRADGTWFAPPGGGAVSVDGSPVTTPNFDDGGDINFTATASNITGTVKDDSVDGTDIIITSQATGTIMYYNGTDWVVLPVAAGDTGEFLRANGVAAPSWEVAPGTGTLTNAGNCDGPNCFNGAEGSQLTFDNAGGDCTLSWNGTVMDFGCSLRANSVEADPTALPGLTFDDSNTSNEPIDALIQANASDEALGSEDVDLIFSVLVASSLTPRISIIGSGNTIIPNLDGSGILTTTIGDAALAVGAVDGGSGGEIADNTINASDIDEAAAYAWTGASTHANGIFDGLDAGPGATRTAEAKILISSHNTDCTALTDGVFREQCFNEQTNALWICEAADGVCNTAPEWTLTAGGGGSSPWQGTDPVSLLLSTGDVIIGSSIINSSKLSIDGDADQTQLTIQANGSGSGQTSNPLLFIIENSSAADLFSVSNLGAVEIAGGQSSATMRWNLSGSLDPILTAADNSLQSTVPISVAQGATAGALILQGPTGQAGTITFQAPSTLAGTRSCVLTDTIAPIPASCISGSVGTFTNVGNSDGPTAFTGTEGTILTSTSGDSFDMATDNTFDFVRTDDGAVTLRAADGTAAASLVVTTTGAGAITIGTTGAGNTTSITLATDSTGNGEVVLPDGAIGSLEVGADIIQNTHMADNAIGSPDVIANSLTSVDFADNLDFSGDTTFLVPTSTTPSMAGAGRIAIDSDLWGASRGSLLIYDGTAATAAVNVLVSDTPSNGQVPKWNTGGTITWEADTGGSGADVALDLGDDSSDESLALVRINIAGTDTNTIFTHVSNELFINVSDDWPKADTSDDLTCTDCIGATEIADIYVLNTGDTITGNLTFDASGDSSQAIFVSSPSTWSMRAEADDGWLWIEISDTDTEAVAIANLGSGDAGLVVEGSVFGKAFVNYAGDGAEAGAFRLVNNDSICWEESGGAGVDVCLTADSSEIVSVSGGQLSANIGDSAAGFFTTGQIEAARGGTGDDSSGATGIAQVAGGDWTYSLTLPNNFAVPNGGPTIDVVGELGVDTSGDDQLAFYGDAKRVLMAFREQCVALEDPVDADDNIAFYFPRQPITITDVYCQQDGGTSIALVISDGTNALESITCDDDGAEDDGSIANGTFAALERMEFDLGAPSGSVTLLNFCVTYTLDAQ